MNSIIDYLEHWAAVQPDTCFSGFLNGAGETREAYSYRDFHERTRSLAEHLSAHTGLKYGDRALLVYPPGLEGIVAFFACARIGVIPVPAPALTVSNPEAVLAKLGYIARDCRPVAVLTSTDTYRGHKFPAGHGLGRVRVRAVPEVESLEWIATDGLERQASDDFRNNTNPVLFLQYTSGSTSDPRGVIVSHQNVIHNAQGTIDHVPIGVSWLPQYHDMGLIGYYLFPMVMGGTSYGISPLDFLKRPLLWLQTISRVRATYASSPNFGFEYCLREDKIPTSRLEGLDLSSVRVLMNASEPVRAETYSRFLRRFAPYGLQEHAHVAAYGLAENTLAVTHYGRRILELDKGLFHRGTVSFGTAHEGGDSRLRLVSCGRPLERVHVRIVDPKTRADLGEQIGEIWIAGTSVCHGYWNRPELTADVFRNTVAGDALPQNGHPIHYLRTGDLGFLSEGELFVCGRIKDLIIIRGVNYYPHDIERIVESASTKIRCGGVAAFQSDDELDFLIVLAEVRSTRDLPDPAAITLAMRTQYSIEPNIIAWVAPGSISRTTSGKTARQLTRRRWLQGDVPALAIHRSGQKGSGAGASGYREHFRSILGSYCLAGNQGKTFAELGIDSLTLVTLISGVERLIEESGATYIGNELDARVIQKMTLGEFFSLIDQLESASSERIAGIHALLKRVKQEIHIQESEQMRADAMLERMSRPAVIDMTAPFTDVLFTGPTGFFGPFLLNSLLRHTSCTYHTLIRATNAENGMHRIRTALQEAELWTPGLERELKTRVRVVCGDISLHNLGLRPDEWKALVDQVQAVFHNAAFVNYVRNYEALRPHNVEGTRELLRFASAGKAKEFHYVSSTIIFGWTRKGTLFESDNNTEMSNLDFGYSQSKWVAEQLVFAAEGQGLKSRIYRPSFISASTGGIGSRGDIAILMLAFMINHGMAVNTLNQVSFLPADIAADNISLIFRDRHLGTGPYHVTVKRYYNMIDITRTITRDYGCEFRYYDLPDFIAEMRSCCGRGDPLYPLLYFFADAHPKFAAMQEKRYSNERYRAMRSLSGGRDDPSLKDTVSYLMASMVREGMIDVRLPAPAPG